MRSVMGLALPGAGGVQRYVLIALAKPAAALAPGRVAGSRGQHSGGFRNDLLLAPTAAPSWTPPIRTVSAARLGVWSLFGAGLVVAVLAVAVTQVVQGLLYPEPATDFIVGYVVLAISFVLEGISFLQSTRQARQEAELFDRDLIEHVLATSDPTLRAVFAEDSAALVGLIIAAAALATHELTGSSVPDAVGSILIGLLLAWVAGLLINRNRRFLVGEEADPRVRAATIRALMNAPEVARVTYLRLEIVGPRMVTVVGDVDLTGDDTESHVAVRLRALEAKISASPAVVGALLSLSAPDEPSLQI
jgi:Co/Zn/Cd efflux system component